MATIVTLETGATAKGSPLTNAEVDNNFINLNNDKLEKNNPSYTGTLTGSGNLGLGLTPSAWDGPGWLQVMNGVLAKSSVLYSGTNAYYNAGWKYASNGAATLLADVNGERTWYTAVSGTAGNGISFVTQMVLNTSGNLGVGTASPVTKLDVSSATTTQVRVNMTGQADVRLVSDTGYGALSIEGYMPLLFRTNATERARIDASGDLTTANGRINLITVGRGGGGVASNTASGLQALQSNTTGVNNTASGVNALYYNTTGNYNTASGLNALYYNTTGGYNTASGVNALYYNTTGANNTASGVYALYSNTTGYSNTASGYSALQSNTTGYSNTASGLNALYYNTTGHSNTASGVNALQSNTTGYNNTASGYQALYSNTTGYNNTASGLYALYANTTGNYNTASGYAALYYNTTGGYNTASGRSGYNPDNDIAQYRITTDFDMTLVGYGATKDNAGQLWNSTAIGARAKVTKSNQVVLGDSNVTETLINGNLGIGTVGNTYYNQVTSYKAGATANYIQVANGMTGLAATNGLRVGVNASGVGEVLMGASTALSIDTSGNIVQGASYVGMKEFRIHNPDTTATSYTTQAYLRIGVGPDMVGGLKAVNTPLSGLATKALYLTTEGNFPIAFGLNNSPNPSMILGLNHFLGVGINTPTSKIHAYGAAANTPIAIRVETGASGNTFDCAAVESIATGGAWGSFTAWATGSARGGQVWVNSVGIHPLVFGVGDLERARFDTSGNLGIGITTPLSKLHVVGTIRSGSTSSTNGSVLLEDMYTSAESLVTLSTKRSSGGVVLANGLKQAENATGFVSSSGAVGALARTALVMESGHFKFLNAAGATVARDSAVTMTEVMRVDLSGQLVLTTPLGGVNGQFKVVDSVLGGDVRFGKQSGASNDAIMGTWTNNGLKLYTNSLERVAVDPSGNLGLGVTPSVSTLPSFDSSYGIFSGAEINLVQNAYYAGGWSYKASADPASRYYMDGGTHTWSTAAAGTANNPISFTAVMGLNTFGTLTITSLTPQASVYNHSGGAYSTWQVNGTSIGDVGAGNQVISGGSSADFAISSRSGKFIFGINGASKMMLDTSGDFTTANGRINLITVGRGGGGVASNTASGVSALQSNTTGYGNTASGYAALQSNTTGSNNTASGYAALQSNTTGVSNTASGVFALQSNTTGANNTASGVSALYYNTTGYSNTASGVSALYYNTTGYSNTASGVFALQSNTTGANNTASGVSALYYNTTGYSNTASGRSGYNPDNDIAQYRITTDFDMTLVGYGATKDNVGQVWNSTAIGARAKVTKSNQVVLGDSNVTETLINGNLGVGTSAPISKLSVDTAAAGTPLVSIGQFGDSPYLEINRWTGSGANYYGTRITTNTSGMQIQTATAGAQGAQTYSNRVTLDTVGNLLVGLTSAIAGERLGVTSTSNGIRVNTTAATSTSLTCSANTSSLFIEHDATSNAKIRSGSGGINFATSGVSLAMSLDAAGNIAIGGAPYDKLHVYGDLRLDPGSGAVATLKVMQTGVAFKGLNLEASEFKFRIGTTDKLRLDTAGQLGIGTESNTYYNQLTSYKAGATANYIQVVNGMTGLAATNGLRVGVNASGVGEVLMGASTALSIDTSGNVGIGTGTPGARITGDFSNSTIANRLMLQTSTVNGNTGVSAIPNGIATTSNFNAFNNADPTNASIAQMIALSNEVRFTSGAQGSGTFYPMTFYTGGSERMRIAADGSITVGTGQTAAYPPAVLQIAETGHATSKRAGMLIGARWLLAQDYVGNGTKDLFIYDSVAARLVLKSDTSGNTTFNAGTFGYGAGAGITPSQQTTNKGTAVVADKPSGLITTHAATLNANSKIAFIVTNSFVTVADTVSLNVVGGTGDVTAYLAYAFPYAGGFYITLWNTSASNLSDAVQIKFNVIKGSNT